MRKNTRSFLSASVAAVLACLPEGVIADTNAIANRLFVQAVQGWHEVERLTGHDTASARLRLEKIAEVLDAVEGIVYKHSGSDLAVQFIIGENVGPLSIPMLKEMRRDADLDLKLSECADKPTVRCLIEHASNIANEASINLSSFYLRDIAAAQAQAKFYDDSIQTIESIEDFSDRDYARSNLAVELAEAGRISQALDVASHLSIEPTTSRAFQAIILAQIEAGNFQEAERLLGRIVDQDIHRRTLMEYTKAIALEGEVSTSLKLLDDFASIYKSAVMNEISEKQVSMGDYRAAWDVAQKIPDSTYFCEAAVRVGLAIDDHELIEKIVGMTLNMEDAFDRLRCLHTLGTQTSRQDLLLEARRLTVEVYKADVFFAVTREIDAGFFEAAYNTALIEDRLERRSDLLRRVAISALKAKEVELVERILPSLIPQHEAPVRGALWSIDGREEHISRMWTIANEIEDDDLSGQFAVQDFVGSVSNVNRLERALQIAAAISDQDLREGAISSVSIEYAKAGNFSKAVEHLKKIEDPGNLVDSLLEVAAEMY